MITVHHLENSRSQSILWLLEELEVDYKVVEYKRDPATSAGPESLKAIHPLGKSPVVTDGELVIAESGSIIEYLLDAYDTEHRLRPTSGQALLDYRYWLHFAEGSLMPLLVMKLVMMKVPTNPMPFFIKPVAKMISEKVQDKFIKPRIEPQLSFIEKTLGEHLWFSGDELSGADIQMSFPLKAASGRIDLTDFPNIGRFLKQVDNQPAYKRILSKGGIL